jgi:hypothetical protein
MILSNINTMALGEIIEESSGKITGEGFWMQRWSKQTCNCRKEVIY